MACCNCNKVSTQATTASTRCLSLCTLVWKISIFSWSETYSSSTISISSFQVSVICMTCCRSTDNWLWTKFELVSSIGISSFPCSDSSGNSIAWICWYSWSACSIYRWWSCTHAGIYLAAGVLGFCAWDRLGASVLYFHINHLLLVGIVNHVTLIWWRNESIKLDCCLFPMRTVFEVTMVHACPCRIYDYLPFILPRYL